MFFVRLLSCLTAEEAAVHFFWHHSHLLFCPFHIIDQNSIKNFTYHINEILKDDDNNNLEFQFLKDDDESCGVDFSK